MYHPPLHCSCLVVVYLYDMSCQLILLTPRQNGRHFADDTFKHIFVNENVRISINISLKFVPKGLINNNPALVQIMAWRRPGDKSLSEPMMVVLPTHICVTRPQWVNWMLSALLSEWTSNQSLVDELNASGIWRIDTQDPEMGYFYCWAVTI